jgi:hypothetical protein
MSLGNGAIQVFLIFKLSSLKAIDLEKIQMEIITEPKNQDFFLQPQHNLELGFIGKRVKIFG